MKLQPLTIPDLQGELRRCSSARVKIAEVDIGAFASVLEHSPEDMTASVQAGMSFAAFQQIIGLQGQWLPIDPPLSEETSIRDLLDHNISGPRRCGYGTVRDYVIGIKVALANGEVIRSGGNVVKNVAGYDLAKLFIGAKGTLGVIVEVTFKLKPKPEVEAYFSSSVKGFSDLEALRTSVVKGQLNPTIFDLHSHAPQNQTVVLGVDGAVEDVAQQKQLALELGFSESAPTLYWNEFWLKPRPKATKLSSLPSKTVATLLELSAGSHSFACIAHLQNGIIYYRNGSPPPAPKLPLRLMARTKETFDPSGIFPQFEP